MMDRYLEAWGVYRDRGFEAFLGYCTDDVLVEEYDGAPGAQAWRGHAGFREMWGRWEQDLGAFSFEPVGDPEQIAPAVIARRVRVRGTGRASGIEVDWNLVMGTVMREGLIAHQFLVDSLEEARARVS